MARRSVLLRLLPLLLLNAASAANNASLVNSLRRHLLTDLDPKVAPSTPNGGLVTKVQFRIFKVISVDVSSGALVLKVWRRVRWFDERLAWDPANFEGLRTVLVYPSGESASLDDNLWLPHVVVYNALKADHAMFETGAAWVRSDGRVHWSVPGTIEITCRFSGLVNFPNDELTCPMEVASWSLADDVTNLTFFDDPTDPDVLALGDRGCAQVSVQSAATAMSYQEYELIDKVKCVKYTRSYPCCPDSPWTQLWIIVGVRRRSQFYGRFIQFPGIALTMSAFSSFWFDAPSAVSGRIGFSAAMLLSTIVLQNTASRSLPKCPEWVWLDYLNMLNFVFCLIALVASAVAIHNAFGFIGKSPESGPDIVDYWCRRLIPLLYLLLLVLVYALESSDGYGIKSSNGIVSESDVSEAGRMFEGIAPHHSINPPIVAAGWVSILVLALCASIRSSKSASQRVITWLPLAVRNAGASSTKKDEEAASADDQQVDGAPKRKSWRSSFSPSQSL